MGERIARFFVTPRFTPSLLPLTPFPRAIFRFSSPHIVNFFSVLFSVPHWPQSSLLGGIGYFAAVAVISVTPSGETLEEDQRSCFAVGEY